MAPPSNKNPLPPPFAPTRLATHAINKDARPGAIDMPKPRRTPAEMQAIRDQQAYDKQEKQEKQEKALKNAADIEDEQRQEDLERAAMSNVQKPQVASFRPPPPIKSQQAKEQTETKKRTFAKSFETLVSSGIIFQNNDRDCYRSEGADALPESSDHEFESEEELHVVDKGASKKGKPGCCEIAAVRRTVPTTGSKSASEHSKRERSPSAQTVPPNKKAKKSNQLPSGLRSGWDSNLKSASSITQAIQPDHEDDSLTHYGGIVGDNEDDKIERSAVENDKGKKGSQSQYMRISTLVCSSTIKIEVKPSIPRMQREARGGSGKKWKLEHLPKDTSEAFTNQLVPLAKSVAGTLSPWEGLLKDQIQELVDKVYGPSQYTVQDAPMDPWSPLISYRLNNWRNGFGTKAAEALKRYIEVDQAEFFENSKIVADWVQFSLTPHGNPPTYPFLWREWKIDDETEKVTKKGRLQNPLILYTLALAHFAEWEDVPDPERLSDKEMPYGAFILALQAVQHALKAWTTGEYIEPRGSSNHFSADNYGDRTERKSDKGRTVNVLNRHATQYMPTVKVLTKDHWNTIFTEISLVLAENKPKRKRSRSASSRGSEPPEEEETSLEYVLVSDVE